jgi:hypothetical protein
MQMHVKSPKSHAGISSDASIETGAASSADAPGGLPWSLQAVLECTKVDTVNKTPVLLLPAHTTPVVAAAGARCGQLRRC